MISKFGHILFPLTAFIISTIILFIVRGVTFKVLHRWASRTETDIDNIIIRAIKTSSVYWCIAIGLYIGVAISDLPDKYVFYISKIIHIIVILSIAVASANLSGKIFTNYIQRSNLPIPTTGLAVALALQDTLSNLFAGIHILVEKSIRVGDFVRLETGQEGYVEDITWRTTRIRMLPNNMVIIPNNKLA